MTTDDIYVQINGERVRLEGVEAEKQRVHMQKLVDAFERQQEAAQLREQAVASACQKLAALGLTEQEVKALLG